MLVYHFEGVPRNPVSVALKNILTLGIYTKVWLYRVNREMDGHEGFHINLRWLGVMVAIPLLTPIIVKFQTVRRLNKMVAHQLTVPILRSRYLGWISLVPVIGQFVYAWWVQGTLNKHWFWHRREERIRLGRERIKEIAAEPETGETLQKRFELEQECRALEAEIREEIEAAELRLGPDRWKARKEYAERMSGDGRMSRKELAEMRQKEKAARKAEKAERKKARGVDDRDPENDAHWLPTTKPPERTADEIRAAAEGEERELTEEEQSEIKAAEKAQKVHDKEVAKLAKEREAARKAVLKREKAAEKDKLKAEREKAKKAAAKEKAAAKKKAKQPAKGKKPKGSKKPKKAKKGNKPKGGRTDDASGGEADLDLGGEDMIPVKRRTFKAPPQAHEAGEGPLRTLNITCPRCSSEIQGVHKRGDKPAKVTCPSCKLVGKV